jgi:hypothetical protein
MVAAYQIVVIANHYSSAPEASEVACKCAFSEKAAMLVLSDMSES